MKQSVICMIWKLILSCKHFHVVFCLFQVVFQCDQVTFFVHVCVCWATPCNPVCLSWRDDILCLAESGLSYLFGTWVWHKFNKMYMNQAAPIDICDVVGMSCYRIILLTMHCFRTLLNAQETKPNKFCGLSPRASCTDRTTAACWQS